MRNVVSYLVFLAQFITYSLAAQDTKSVKNLSHEYQGNNDKRITSIHRYAQRGQTDSVLYSISHGIYVNIPTQKINQKKYQSIDDFTPLMFAAQNGHLSTCNVLMLYGADPFVQNADKKSAIDLAKENGFKEVVKALTSNDYTISSSNWTQLLNKAQDAYLHGEFIIANAFTNAALHKFPREQIKTSPFYDKMLQLLAETYEKMGIYSKAEILLTKSLEWNKENAGVNSGGYISSLIRLSCLFNELAYTEKNILIVSQLRTYLKNVNLIEKVNYAKILDAIGTYYHGQSKYVLAARWFSKALRVKKEMYGIDSYDYGISLLGIFKAFKSKKRFWEANKNNEELIMYQNPVKEYINEVPDALTKKEAFSPKLMTHISELIKKRDGDVSTNYLESLFLLEYSYENFDKKREQIATELINRTKAKVKSVNYQRGLLYPIVIKEDIVRLQKPVISQSEFDYLLEMKFSIEKTYGKIHPLYIEVLKNLSVPKSSNVDNQYIGECKKQISIIQDILLYKKSVGSVPLYYDPQIYIALSEDIQQYNSNILQFYLTFSQSQEGTLQLLFNHVVANKARNLNHSAKKEELNEDALNFAEHTVKEDPFFKNADVTKAKKAMKDFYLSIHRTMISMDKFSDVISNSKNAANNYGSFNSTEEDDDNDPYQTQDDAFKNIKFYLKEDEVLVEYFSILKTAENYTKAVEYYALIVRSNNTYPSIVLKYLFNENEMKALSSNGDFFPLNVVRDTEPQKIPKRNDLNSKNRRLYELCWGSVASVLMSSEKKIYYTPSGILNQISFASLKTPDDLFLIDKFKLFRLSSSLFLTPEYNKNIDNISNERKATKERIILFGNPDTEIGRLSGASAEIKEIKRIMGARKRIISTFEGPDATEQKLMELGKENISPYILHIASHGAFVPDTVMVKSKNPMLRSFLYLSGSSSEKAKLLEEKVVDDGLVTAFEVSKLNFAYTELVVLSACKTAQGMSGADEGIFGLTRAFKEAGAKYVVSSLWAIPDKETSEMMAYFYQNIAQKESIPDAFDKAQLKMRQKYPSVKYWGAFVLIQ